jgi:predicted esterase
VGTIVPKVVCTADSKQSYALYLPSSFSAARPWPIIYVFDPAARGQVAVETIQAAAEKFGYIVVASNNSRNGPTANPAEAANAMWRDTQQRFPIAQQRRYFAGMSGGARVATSIALSCHDCVAGVIANAAGFSPGMEPPHNIKFAYFAAVGNADFNYGEFVKLRRKLDDAGAQYRIRIFDGPHGWAPPEVWFEALNWIDIRAMSAGTLPRDPSRIQQTAAEELARAREFQSQNNLLAALRQFESLVRDFKGLADVSSAENSVAELRNSKAVKAAEKEEASAVAQQAELTGKLSAQMQAIASHDLRNNDLHNNDSDNVNVGDIRSRLAELKKRADALKSTDLKGLVVRRALGELVVEAYESGRSCMDEKNYRAALVYLDLASAGSANPAWAHYQRARAYAMLSDRKNMLAELRLSAARGLHDTSALDAAEFQAFQQQPEFQTLVREWRQAGDRVRP